MWAVPTGASFGHVRFIWFICSSPLPPADWPMVISMSSSGGNWYQRIRPSFPRQVMKLQHEPSS